VAFVMTEWLAKHPPKFGVWHTNRKNIYSWQPLFCQWLRRDNETLTIGSETPIGFAWPAAAASHGSNYPKGNISRLYGSRHGTIILSDGAARISMVSPRKSCRRRVITTCWVVPAQKKPKDYMGSPSFVLFFSPFLAWTFILWMQGRKEGNLVPMEMWDRVVALFWAHVSRCRVVWNRTCAGISAQLYSENCWKIKCEYTFWRDITLRVSPCPTAKQRKCTGYESNLCANGQANVLCINAQGFCTKPVQEVLWQDDLAKKPLAETFLGDPL
jgi:hypothetical protein